MARRLLCAWAVVALASGQPLELGFCSTACRQAAPQEACEKFVQQCQTAEAVKNPTVQSLCETWAVTMKQGCVNSPQMGGGQATSRKLLLNPACSAAWTQCGGGSTSNSAQTVCCQAGSGCVQSNAYYWQCIVGANRTAMDLAGDPTVIGTCPVPIATWGQCGGTGGLCQGGSQVAAGVCGDHKWASGCCPDGYGCYRQSAVYWQCVQGATDSVAPSTPAGPPSSPVTPVSPSATPAATPPPTTTARTPSPTPPPTTTAARTPSPTPPPTTTPRSTPAPPPTTTAQAPPTGFAPYSYLPVGSPFLTTVNDQMMDQNGKPVVLKGIAWYGFGNTDIGQVEGLNQGSNASTQDLAYVMRRMKALGFNTIKLPFSFNTLYETPFTSYPQSCVIPNEQYLLNGLTPPSGLSISYGSNGGAVPQLTAAPQVYGAQGQCNAAYGQASGLIKQRYLYTVNLFAANGFYVMPDWHPGVWQTNQELVNSALWIKNWVGLVNDMINLPNTAGKLILDLLNEPDSYGLMWEQPTYNRGQTWPALQDLYLGVLNGVWAIGTPAAQSILFVIQGTGQTMVVNWGDGFFTDADVLANYQGMSNPNNFFTTIVGMPYINQIVLGPHVYGPSVTGAIYGYNGYWLWWRMSRSFGRKTTQGYCTGTGATSQCERFAVIIGEYGCSFASQNDISNYQDMVSWMNSVITVSPGTEFNTDHSNIQSFVFWGWNPTSGDTGGIVGNDWATIQWYKIAYLAGPSSTSSAGLKLKPWNFN